MRLVFAGSGAFACPTLRWLAQSEHEVPFVLTQPARGSGRGRHTTRTPVAAQAAALGFEVLEVEDVNEPSVVERVAAMGARLGLVIAFGQKLGEQLLTALPGGFVNLHASLLPKFRGAAPINWAIVRGAQRTGCTVFRIVEKMDAGPILCARWTEIKPEETAGELHDRLAGIGVDAVQATLAMFEGNIIPPGEPQNHAEATHAPKLRKSDGLINWNCSARDVVNHIHGMTPWPGARSRFVSGDERWEGAVILRARVAEDPAALMGTGKPATSHQEPESQAGRETPVSVQPDASAQGDGGDDTTPVPGTIDVRRYVTTADGFVEILEIKPSSGRVMTWPEYVNGRHVKPGDVFE